MVLGIKPKTFYSIHSWVGITAGLLLFVICWSGSIAVFSNEIDWILNPSMKSSNVISVNQSMDWERAYDRFKEKYPNDRLGELAEPTFNGLTINGWGIKEEGHLFRFYMDPLTYRIQEETTYFNVQRFFRSFHMSLFDPDIPNILGVNFGYFIVGCFGFVLLASTITGFLFYKKWRSGFFKLSIKKGARRLWSDLHKLIGLWSLWFGVLIGVTGAWYLLEWWLPEPPHLETSHMEKKDESTILKINQLTQYANKAYPELKIQRLFFYNYDKGLISFEGNDGSLLVRKRAANVVLNTQNGAVVRLQKPNDLSIYERWWETVDLLHFGNFGGLWSKWLYFIFGVFLSTLCLTGSYLQAKRQKMKSGIKTYRTTILFSYCFTLLILGLAIWGAVKEIKRYGKNGNWPETDISVCLFILIWCTVTLYILGTWMRKIK